MGVGYIRNLSYNCFKFSINIKLFLKIAYKKKSVTAQFQVRASELMEITRSQNKSYLTKLSLFFVVNPNPYVAC